MFKRPEENIRGFAKQVEGQGGLNHSEFKKEQERELTVEDVATAFYPGPAMTSEQLPSEQKAKKKGRSKAWRQRSG